MRLYSTNNKTSFVSLKKAVLKGLPDDNGLFMPKKIEPLAPDFFKNLKDNSFESIAYAVSKQLIGDAIPEKALKNIVAKAVTFPAPLVQLDEQRHILELFHGPTLAFKDFGARFMAQLMGYFNKEEQEELVILVATSGDTGGAVASGFHNVPGIKVVILYPSGKVSHLQEQQLTTLGGNISALEVNGTFDDCQAMVKEAFLDKDLNQKIRLSSANSINIARLIPQSFYYFEAMKQLGVDSNKPTFVIPSGNFGNLTAGVIAQKLGLPIYKFIAATNANDVIPQYISSGIYQPRPSVRTISNAMDVGKPSNFARLDDFYCSTWNNFKANINGYSFSDQETIEEITRIQSKYDYIIDPHGAVGTLAFEKALEKEADLTGIILETAHPSKFVHEINSLPEIQKAIEIPERLAKLSHLKKESTSCSIDYQELKAYLEEHY